MTTSPPPPVEPDDESADPDFVPSPYFSKEALKRAADDMDKQARPQD